MTRRCKRAARFLLPLLSLLAVMTASVRGSAEGQIYKYVDESGTLNFTTEWSSIPDKYRTQVERLHPSPSRQPSPPLPKPGPPDVRSVKGVGEYRMGDHDTRYDAERLAVEAAKRNALEQVATYLESVTVATNLDLTRDEIRSYTAGLVLVENQQITPRLEDGAVVIHVELTAKVDANEVAQAITALRANDDARTELAVLRQETDQLQQQLASVNQQLQATTDPQQAQQLAQERQGLLDQTQSNALVSQAWTDYVIAGRVVSPYPWYVVGQARSLVNQAWTLNPTNPHVVVIQKTIAPQTPMPPPPGARRHLSARQTQSLAAQSPTWPSVPPHRIPSVHPFSQSTLPPTIHQFHPAPPQPVARQPFQLPPGSGVQPRAPGEGGHGRGGGGHHR